MSYKKFAPNPVLSRSIGPLGCAIQFRQLRFLLELETGKFRRGVLGTPGLYLSITFSKIQPDSTLEYQN